MANKLTVTLPQFLTVVNRVHPVGVEKIHYVWLDGLEHQRTSNRLYVTQDYAGLVERFPGDRLIVVERTLEEAQAERVVFIFETAEHCTHVLQYLREMLGVNNGN